MKTVLIANVSANGKVFLATNPEHQAEPEALGFFMQKIVAAGSVVMGRKTYEVLQHFPGGAKQLLPNVDVVLLSSSGKSGADYKVVNSPEDAIAYFKDKGAKEVVIGGGTETYNAFLTKDLVNEIYFNYVPMIISDGGVLGSGKNLTLNFKLAEHKLLTENIVQVHLIKT
jgi:dihydrofolate reductase